MTRPTPHRRTAALALAAATGLLAPVLTATAAHATGTYDNGTIADKALSYYRLDALGNPAGPGTAACTAAGRTGGAKSRDFADCVLSLGSGGTQYPAPTGGEYQQSLLAAGATAVTAATAIKGDLIQQGTTGTDTLDTAIIVADNPGGSFQVVDTDPATGLVRYRTWTPPASNVGYYRFGTAPQLGFVFGGLSQNQTVSGPVDLVARASQYGLVATLHYVITSPTGASVDLSSSYEPDHFHVRLDTTTLRDGSYTLALSALGTDGATHSYQGVDFTVQNGVHAAPTSAGVTINNHNGAVVVYGLGKDGQIWEDYQQAPGAGNWSGWELNLGAPMTGTTFVSSPSAFVDKFGASVVVAIDTNGDVQENYQTSPGATTWTGWHHYNSSPLPTGVTFTGTAIATTDVNGVNVCYVTGSDGQVYENWLNRSTGLWSGWELGLGTPLAGTHLVSSPSVYVNSTGRLVVTAIDSNGDLQESHQVNPGAGPWTGWAHYNNSPLPTGVTFKGSPASYHDVNGVDVSYLTGSDGQVYENWLNRTTGQWSGWELGLGTPLAGTRLVSSPSVYVNSTGRLVVTAIDSNGDLQESHQVNPGAGPWTGWAHYNNSPLPTGVTFLGNPSSTKDANGVDISYLLGTDGQVYENWLNRSTGQWSGWELGLRSPAVPLEAV
ncbi:hypothetical protein P3T36_000385 [Kitasatospora sp. MAP12-15]|uniref:hypothetical protein n=1 Tax=unclassified Kitasatospora TaxID=2633591 RepID=UPI00247502CD|nr:hypothetical protein [Kitasatospora sp. MAP12-44]MDH6109614.1 hypothetical protein [Kitasatospora sp. MAP12-44]